jgi:hypothetical protein
MNEQVIAAADAAFWDAWEEQGCGPFCAMESAIRAADLARADAVKAAVAHQIEVCTDEDDEFGFVNGHYMSRIDAAEWAIYTLLGIGDAE